MGSITRKGADMSHAAVETRRILCEIVDDAVGHGSDPLWIVRRDLIEEAIAILALQQSAAGGTDAPPPAPTKG